MNKMNVLHKKKRSIVCFMLVVALLMMVFVPVQQGFAAPICVPTGVDGRVLSASMAGDTSAWIEIARSGDYSLIVRKDVLPLGWVSFPTSGTNNDYRVSNARNAVNNWFKNTLSSNARLRDYTVKSDAVNNLGGFASLSYGLSTPSSTMVKTGDDVAFMLSFAEAASFCSMQYATSTSSWTTSSAVARSNFGKLTQLPTTPPQRDFWWLRSSGHSSTSVSSVGTHSKAMANCVFASSSLTSASYVYIRPALWVGSSVFETSYSVTVVNSYAAVSGAGNYVSGSTVTVNAGSRPGYAFAGWTTQGIGALPNNSVASFTMPSNNVVVTANWLIEQYTVSYVLNGGVLSTGYPTSYNVGNGFTVNTNTVGTPEFLGYRFVNWRVTCSNGTGFNLTPAGIPADVTGNIVLSAIWDPMPILYSITYDLSGGVNANGNPTSYTVAGIFPVNIANPSRAGYSFAGWTIVYTNGTIIPFTSSYSIPAGSACNVTLHALWAPITQTYNINYVLDNGVIISGNPTTYTTSNLPLNIPAPYRPDNIFLYWTLRCANGTNVILTNNAIPAGTTGDVTLTATWMTAPATYTITYALNGGNNVITNPTTYTTGGTSPISIADPSMPSHTFLYWVVIYADGTLNILPSSGIPAGTTGNIMLVAVWYP